MARMYPIPIRSDTLSYAERRLYEEFSRQLPDEFVVFHSVWWQIRNTMGGVRDGEADFVIAHPDFGILLVEVKGGHIRYEGQMGQWFSNDIPIKDPFTQVREAKYSLLAKLKEIPYWRNRWITVGYSVAFPDVAVKGDLRLDAPRELILDASDMGHLVTWVNQALQHLQGRRPDDSPLGAVGVKELTNLLSPSWNLNLLLSAKIREEEQELARLTEEQFVMLDFLGRQRRAAISGCAGSGKTTLALEKGKRLAEHGFHALITCYNTNLAEFLRSDETLPHHLDVVNFHKLAQNLADKAGLAYAGARDDHYFDKILPELMMEAVSRLGPKYDAIIVDEGQDFCDNWWMPLQYLLHDPDQGIFYVFFDDNQNLYRAAQTVPLELAPFPLTRNCRNTQHIHQTVMQFYRSDQSPVAQGPAGRQVEVRTYNGTSDLKQALRQVLHKLVVEENIPVEDIVVLTPKGRQRSDLWRLGMLGNLMLTDQWAAGSGEVFCTTIHAFKGLESPIVILAEIEPEASQDMESILYVGCSRACNHLVVLASARLSEDMKQRLSSS
ncbi:MAG: NERD domain-containing protein [Thermoflexales bacterium]|nr:NERD domain-containing protein [Thermoflexales bacterium]